MTISRIKGKNPHFKQIYILTILNIIHINVDCSSDELFFCCSNLTHWFNKPVFANLPFLWPSETKQRCSNEHRMMPEYFTTYAV